MQEGDVGMAKCDTRAQGRDMGGEGQKMFKLA